MKPGLFQATARGLYPVGVIEAFRILLYLGGGFEERRVVIGFGSSI